jgi:hypothetical protein
MTGLEEIKQKILKDERFELIGEKEAEGGVAVYFFPRIREYSILSLEKKFRELFVGVPEISGIPSTQGEVVMMTCSERISHDVRFPLRRIYVQCFLDGDTARKEYDSPHR